MVTELIFEGALNDLKAEEIASLLSCLIFKPKADESPVLIDRLIKVWCAPYLPVCIDVVTHCRSQAKDRLKDIAKGLGNLQFSCGIDKEPTEFVRENVNDALMQVVYEWGKGTVRYYRLELHLC